MDRSAFKRHTEGVTEKQFQKFSADVEEIKTLLGPLEQIAENTKPASKVLQALEFVGLIATIGGLVGFVEQVIQWISR